MTYPTRNPPIYTPSNEAASLSNQAMLATVLFLFLVAVFIFFFYLYAKYRLRSLREDHLVFADSDQITGQGLDSELLKTLPVKNYLVSEFKDGLECAVCLSELSEGEQLRLLPKCNHGFHVDCIDKWFHAHTTCPLCRTPVTDTEEPVKVEIQEGTQNLNLPTNVLFWGNQDQVSHGVRNQTEEEDASSSSSTRVNNPEGMLVIDIPRRGVEVDFVPPTVSPLPTSKFPSEEARTPMTVRLRSLTRLLSRGKMVIGFSSSSPSSSSSSPKGGDIEQGIVEGSSCFAPKTPISK